MVSEKEIPTAQVYLSAYIKIDEYNAKNIFIGLSIKNLKKGSKKFNYPIFKSNTPIEGISNTLYLVDLENPIPFPVELNFGDEIKLKFNLRDQFFEKMKRFKGQNVTLTAYINTTVGETLCSNPMNIDDLFRFNP